MSTSGESLAASSALGGRGVRPSHGPRLAGIEGLRAVAASSVLVLHTWLYAPPGDDHAELGRRVDMLMPHLGYGVVLFFTLSGFLLYRPFARSILHGERLPAAAAYLRNRALRIVPAYWVILLICAVVLGSVLYRDDSGQLLNGRLVDPALLAATGVFVQGYVPDTLLTGIGPAWSLAVEVVFYLILPLLALLGVVLSRRCQRRAGRRWAALAPAALLLVFGLTGKAAAAFLVPPPAQYDGWGANWHSVVERSFWGHADLFAFGMALAIARVDAEDGLLRLPRWWRRAAATAFLAIAAFLALYGEGELSYSPGNTLAAVACALLLALVVLPGRSVDASPLVRGLERRAFIAVGVVSYSVFLWHEPLIRWLDEHGLTASGRTGFILDLALVAGVTGVAATLTYRFVEAPALRLKRARPTARRGAASPGAPPTHTPRGAPGPPRRAAAEASAVAAVSRSPRWPRRRPPEPGRRPPSLP
jgi:peptidoglycan/LPS O-acetylase OafA/YrhL